MKMSQKRALIGATIIATAASDYFTQDMEPDETPAVTQAKEAALANAPKTEEPKDVSRAEVASEVPVCCGKEMMVSKYADRDTGEFPYYCMKCRKKSPSGIMDSK
jgi:hypothetical protein